MSKDLSPSVLAQGGMNNLGARPDMDIKVNCRRFFMHKCVTIVRNIVIVILSLI